MTARRTYHTYQSDMDNAAVEAKADSAGEPANGNENNPFLNNRDKLIDEMSKLIQRRIEEWEKAASDSNKAVVKVSGSLIAPSSG